MSALIQLIFAFFKKFAPEFIVAILTSLISLLVPILTKATAVFGLTTFTLYGIHLLELELTNNVKASFNGLPADVLAIVAIMKLDVAFSLISSAVVVKWTMNGWKSQTDSISHTTLLPPPAED